MEHDYKWYVIKSVSGQEKKVKIYIENELKREKMEDLVKQILIPVEKVIQLRKGKKVTKEKSYFPGYILIEAEMNGEIQHTIKNIVGVIGFLPPKKDPVPLRQSEVNRILGKVDAINESGGFVEVPFVMGEPVKVVDGPFNGFSGTIEEINEEKKKLKVIVKIFGRRTPLELNYMQVEKE